MNWAMFWLTLLILLLIGGVAWGASSLAIWVGRNFGWRWGDLTMAAQLLALVLIAATVVGLRS